MHQFSIPEPTLRSTRLLNEHFLTMTVDHLWHSSLFSAICLCRYIFFFSRWVILTPVTVSFQMEDVIAGGNLKELSVCQLGLLER